MDIRIIAAILIAILLVVVFVVFYNRINVYRNAAEATLGQIRVAMKKRLDVVEQLLGAVKGYMDHERGYLARTVVQVEAKFLSGNKFKFQIPLHVNLTHNEVILRMTWLILYLLILPS